MKQAQATSTALATVEQWQKPIEVAFALAAFEQSLTPAVMSILRGLAGTPIGFLMDKDNYDDRELRHVIIEALMNGVALVGNEFNVIAGRLFIAKNGWLRKLKDAGATGVDVAIGAPENVEAATPGERGYRKFTATFSAQASCIANGKRVTVHFNAGAIDTRVTLSAFGKDLVDSLPGLKGKVESRILKRLWSTVTDMPAAEDEVASVDVIEVPVKQVDDEPEGVQPDPVNAERDAATAAISKLVEMFKRKLSERGECGLVEYGRRLMACKTTRQVALVVASCRENLDEKDAQLIEDAADTVAEAIKLGIFV